MSTLALLQAPAESSVEPDFAEQVARAEPVFTDHDAAIVAYDRAGEQIGAIVHWTEPDGSVVVYADYPDGFAQYTISEAGVETVSTLAPDVLEERAAAMAAHLGLDITTGPQEGVGACAAGIITTSVGLAAANPWALISGLGMACACLPIVFKGTPEGDIECPGW